MNLQNVLQMVDSFHITDRKLMRARKALEGGAGPAEVAVFCREAQRYFRVLQREAEQDMRSVDRRLDDLYQLQYNLQAEHAVAQRRRDGARELLEALGD
ncbi:MAG: hypothetical protein M3Z37_05045 [Candidatus Eremiobacteraeota bacterium]|nr:hypothetical protein [Candidatus Eremiobacteraeota bacterium]